MKKLIVIIVLLVTSNAIASEVCYLNGVDSAKTIDSLNKKIEALAKLGNQREQEFVNTISKIANSKQSKKDVGFLSLKRSSINRYDRNYNKKSIDIRKVDVSILDGTIYSIQVVGNDSNIYSNKQSQISLSSFNKRYHEKLYEENSSGVQFIELGDFLRYQSNFGKLSLPDDTTFSLIPGEKDTIALLLDPALSGLIEGRIYSDVLGLSGGSNAILQTEFNSKFIGNTVNIRGTRVVLVNYVAPYFSFSKFDSKFDTTFLEKDTSISRMKLLQLSPVQFGLKLNLLSYYRMYRFEINAGLQGNITRNIVFPDSTITDINQYSVYTQVSGTFTRGSNFGLELSAKLAYNWLADKPQLNSMLNPKSIWVFNPEAVLYWYSGEEKNNKIFFRYRGFYNLSSDDTNFIQLQAGYSFNINSLFK